MIIIIIINHKSKYVNHYSQNGIIDELGKHYLVVWYPLDTFATRLNLNCI